MSTNSIYNDTLPKLLRAIANTETAKATKHDIIFNAAADSLERYVLALLAIKRLPDGDAGFCRGIADEALNPPDPRARLIECIDCGSPLYTIPGSGDRMRCNQCLAQYG